MARQALPRVHGGFWEAYSKMREKVLAVLASELQVNTFKYAVTTYVYCLEYRLLHAWVKS